jgi:DNA-binding response OmpR family regulator
MATWLPRILCVDDEPEVLGILSQYFIEEGFAVRTATSANEALVEAKRWMPKVLVVDLFMPRLGGLETVERIRKVNPGIVVVLISGRPDALQRATETGMAIAGAFPKPLNLPEMLSTLYTAGVVPLRISPEALRDAAARNRAKVLVVDDEVDICEVLAEYLKGKGFDVIQANRGEEALELVRQWSPEVVLLDLAMPGLSGLETLRRIRMMSGDTAVVVITANADVETARQTLSLGALDYVPKPVDFGYLDSVLAGHVLGQVEA